MAIYALGSKEPRIHPDAYVHPQATIIGEVAIGARSSIWPGAVLRGDDGGIVIGDETSIQDGAVIHCTPELPTVVGDRCVIGHLAHLEGCTVEAEALIGVGAAVLHRARIGSGALVAAGAVVLGDTDVPTGALAVGVPATIKPDRADRQSILDGARSYVERAEFYASELRRLD